MKQSLIAAGFLLAAQALFVPVSAQDSTTTKQSLMVIAHVSNVFTHAPIVEAQVEIMDGDSTVIAKAESSRGKYNGRTGGFSFELKKPGRYIVHCMHPDFEDSYATLDVKRFYKHEQCRTGDMFYMQRRQPKASSMTDGVHLLKEVVVKATKVKFYLNGDTLVYNADAFNLSEGSMLDALIRQLPGAELKDNGEIMVNGRRVDELLLNGKNFFNRDRKIILDNLPSFMVRNVKVFEQMSQMQQLTHDSTGHKNYVMDIGLKREYQIGWIANAEGGAGSDDRFLGRLFALRFTPNSQVSLFASANNLSDDRKPGQNGEWTPLEQPVGVTTTRTAGLNYNVDDARSSFNVGGDLTVQHNDASSESHQTATNFLNGGDTYSRSFGQSSSHDTRINTSHSLRMGSAYFAPSFTFRHFCNSSYGASATLSSDEFGHFGKSWMDSIATSESGTMLRKYALNQVLRQAQGSGHDLSTNASFSKFIKVPHNDRINFSMGGTFKYDDTESRSYDHQQISFFSATTTDDYRNRYDRQYQRGHEFSLSLHSWIWMNRTLSIQPMYVFTARRRSTNRSLYLLNLLEGYHQPLGTLPSEEALMSVLDGANSFDATTHDYVHRPGLKFSQERQLKGNVTFRWNLDIPLRLENNRLNYRRGRLDTLCRRSVVFLEPSFDMEWSASQKWHFQAAYSYASEAPAMTYMINIRDDSNPLYIEQTGAALRSHHVHKFYSSYNRILTGQRMYNADFSLNIHQNSIAMSSIYNRENGVRIVTPANVSGNWDTRLGGGFAMPFDSRRFTLQGNTSLSYYHSVDLSGTDASQQPERSMVSSYYVNETLKLDYRPSSKFNIGLKGDLHFQFAEGSRQDFSIIRACDFDYGLTSQVELPWNFQLSTDLTMYSRRGYADPSMNTNELVWNARLSKRFFHGNLICMFDGFDILGNLSNVRLTVNAQGRTETWTNVTPHYAMFHIIYRLNRQPKKK
jgi:hypothetical protein